MKCIRCRGLMVEAHFYDYQGTQGFMSTAGWRCINCGHVADSTTAANRRLQEATLLVRPSEEPESEHTHVYLRANTEAAA